jgi:hypothetical protein
MRNARRETGLSSKGRAMTAALQSPSRFHPLDLLFESCRLLVPRVAGGQLPFLEAVDFAYSAADQAGLVERYGDDAVQGH